MARSKLETHTVPSTTFPLRQLAISLTLFATTAVCVEAQNPQQSSDESWTAAKDTSVANANPSRTTESHTKSGNRTVDTQRAEVLGPNGEYQPAFETESETVRVDGSTTRTVVRVYRWDGNGRRTLAQVTEEESRTTASGDSRTERRTSSADLNGSLQVVRREIADTKKISPDVEERKTTVYGPDGYGGLAQTEQTQESETHRADDSVAVKRTTLRPDGNGSWKVSDVTEKTIKDDGKNRTAEERVSRPDLEGRLYETSRTVSSEGETPTGEKRKTVETYSVLGAGYTDGGMHLNQRVTTVQQRDSDGDVTEQQIEQPNPTSPSDGPKVIARTKYVVKYAAPGTEQSRTAEVRDANGNFNAVSVQTGKSTETVPAQKSAAPPPPPNNP